MPNLINTFFNRRISDDEERAILERAEELLARGVGIP